MIHSGWKVPVLFSAASAAAFAPTDISGFVLWLKNDVGLFQERTGAGASTPASADGDPVGTWKDQSGVGNHLTAASDAARPTKQTVSGTVVVRADGSDDRLSGPTTLITDAMTLFIVAAKVTAASAASKTLWGSGNAEAQFYTNSVSSATYNYYATQATAEQKNLGGAPTSFNIFTLKYTSLSSLSIYVNGGAATTFDPKDSYSTVKGFKLFAENSANNGDYQVKAVLAYNTALSDTDRGNVLSYLNSTYTVY